MMRIVAAICVLFLCFCPRPSLGQDDIDALTIKKKKLRLGGSVAGTWTLVNDTMGSNAIPCSNTCVADTVPSLTAGNLLVVLGLTNGSGNTISSVNPTVGTLTIPANCQVFQAATLQLSCGYTIVANSTTTVDITVAGAESTYAQFEYREYSLSKGTITAETLPSPVTLTTCGNTGSECADPNVTITGSNDVVISGAAPAHHICTVLSPFGNVVGFSSPGWGGADHLNTTSGTGAKFGTATTAGCGTPANDTNFVGFSIAFKGI